MKKLKKLILIIAIISIFTFPINSHAEEFFYEMEYPPNSSGRTDYSDEDAEQQKVEINTSPEDYIGKSSNTYLKSLSVENAKIEPEFNRQYVDYKVTLKNKYAKKINIIAEAEDENATIEGTGEVELQEGTNNLRIVVTAENGNVQFYNLTVENEIRGQESNIKTTIIYLSIAFIIVAIIIIFIIRKK